MHRLHRLLGSSRSFRLLLVAALSDDLAKGIATFLLPLAAITQTTSPVHVAAVTVSLTLPWLIVGPVAGLIVDRFDRRRLLIGAELVRLAALLMLAVALFADLASLPMLYAIALLVGVTETVIEPALIASIPRVSRRSHLDQANARVIGGRTITDNAAQVISGVLVSVGLGVAAMAAASGFAMAAAGYRRMRGAFSPGTMRRAVYERQPFPTRVRETGGAIADGMRVILSTEPLRTITLTSGVINGCWAAWWSVWVLYAIAPGPVGLSAFEMGLLMSVGAIASFLGAMLTLPIQRQFGKRWAIGINILGNGFLFAITAATSEVWPIVFAFLLGEFGAPGWAVAANTWQQRNIPEDMRGRVASAYRVLGFGAKAIGAAVGGVAATQLGIPTLYALCAAGTLATIVPFFRYVTEPAMHTERIAHPATRTQK
ncbi:MAG: MFS transporter [Thermomicrobiales bacterium]